MTTYGDENWVNAFVHDFEKFNFKSDVKSVTYNHFIKYIQNVHDLFL